MKYLHFHFIYCILNKSKPLSCNKKLTLLWRWNFHQQTRVEKNNFFLCIWHFHEEKTVEKYYFQSKESLELFYMTCQYCNNQHWFLGIFCVTLQDRKLKGHLYLLISQIYCDLDYELYVKIKDFCSCIVSVNLLRKQHFYCEYVRKKMPFIKHIVKKVILLQNESTWQSSIVNHVIITFSCD